MDLVPVSCTVRPVRTETPQPKRCRIEELPAPLPRCRIEELPALPALPAPPPRTRLEELPAPPPRTKAVEEPSPRTKMLEEPPPRTKLVEEPPPPPVPTVPTAAYYSALSMAPTMPNYMMDPFHYFYGAWVTQPPAAMYHMNNTSSQHLYRSDR